MNVLALLVLAPQAYIGNVEVSTYHRSLHGNPMASSRHGRYDMRRMTCAVNYKPGTRKPIIPFGTRLRVKYGAREVEVVVTDTGSYKPRKTRVWLDLSSAAMAKLLGHGIDNPRAYETRVVAKAWRAK